MDVVESKTNEPVKFSTQLGYLANADGSAQLNLDQCSCEIMCAVYGPGEVKIMKELAERAYVGVTYKQRVGQTSNREKVLEYTIKSICDGIILTHLHPRTAINIILQEIENGGSQLACAINCTCLALLDANIPLKYTFAAVNCALMKSSSPAEDKLESNYGVTDPQSDDYESNVNLVFFPTCKQEAESLLTITFVFDSVNQDLLLINNQNGRFNRDLFNYLLVNSRRYATRNLFPFFQEKLSKKYIS